MLHLPGLPEEEAAPLTPWSQVGVDMADHQNSRSGKLPGNPGEAFPFSGLGLCLRSLLPGLSYPGSLQILIQILDRRMCVVGGNFFPGGP